MMNIILLKIKKFPVLIKTNINQAAAYFSCLYFFEVLYLMFTVLLAGGKILSVITGFSISLLLVLHIIALYFRAGSSRKIQLVLMDIHAAYAAMFLVNCAVQGIPPNVMSAGMCVIRSLMLGMELHLIVVMSGDDIRDAWRMP